MFAQHHTTLCSDVSGQTVKLPSKQRIGLLEADVLLQQVAQGRYAVTSIVVDRSG